MGSTFSRSAAPAVVRDIDNNGTLDNLSGIGINENASDSASDQPFNFARLPAELVRKIFNEYVDDHDSFQNLVSLSRQMYHMVGPYLQAKRKQIMDERSIRRSVPLHVSLSFRLLGKKEWSLMNGLRINRELTCKAHKIPSYSQLINELGLIPDQLDAGERSYQLLQLAKQNCYHFGEYYHCEVSKNIRRLKKKYRLSAETIKAIEIGFYCYPLFEIFLRRNRKLSLFTDVYWPERMPEKARRRMARQYAKQNARNDEPRVAGYLL